MKLDIKMLDISANRDENGNILPGYMITFDDRHANVGSIGFYVEKMDGVLKLIKNLGISPYLENLFKKGIEKFPYYMDYELVRNSLDNLLSSIESLTFNEFSDGLRINLYKLDKDRKNNLEIDKYLKNLPEFYRDEFRTELNHERIGVKYSDKTLFDLVLSAAEEVYKNGLNPPRTV